MTRHASWPMMGSVSPSLVKYINCSVFSLALSPVSDITVSDTSNVSLSSACTCKSEMGSGKWKVLGVSIEKDS